MNAEQQQNRAIYPMNEVIRHFMIHTDQNIQAEFATQGVWPFEIYPGFHEVNEARRVKAHNNHNKGWWADGSGQNDIHGRLVKADEDTGMVHVVYDMPLFLRFVDMGVGKGVKAHDVQRGAKANWKRRYTTNWDRTYAHRSHRPFLMMELRHLNTRIQNFMTNTLGYKIEMEVYKYFDTEEWKYPF